MFTRSCKGNVVSKIYHGHCCKLDNTMAKGSDLDVGTWQTHIVRKL